MIKAFFRKNMFVKIMLILIFVLLPLAITTVYKQIEYQLELNSTRTNTLEPYDKIKTLGLEQRNVVESHESTMGDFRDFKSLRNKYYKNSIDDGGMKVLIEQSYVPDWGRNSYAGLYIFIENDKCIAYRSRKNEYAERIRVLDNECNILRNKGQHILSMNWNIPTVEDKYNLLPITSMTISNNNNSFEIIITDVEMNKIYDMCREEMHKANECRKYYELKYFWKYFQKKKKISIFSKLLKLYYHYTVHEYIDMPPK